MVYYGLLSKGCQRCRKRKIKCDQRKPRCLKCEKSHTQCPGYRDLGEVIFRDDSERIIRKARQVEQSNSALIQKQFTISTGSSTSSASPPDVNSVGFSLCPISIPYPPSPPIHDLGANFFFANYTFNEHPFSCNYTDWLTQSYTGDGSSRMLRAAIEAVGMAGISNVFHAPSVASKSREHYCEALAAMKQAIIDPVQAIADTTFLAVILLGLFETVNFETWDRYRYWVAHINAATALLELRGQDQFTRERGGQLYVQIRSQILSACVQQHLAVPAILVQTSYHFKISTIRQQWRRRKVASPSSICEISFRIVNLRAALQNGEITNPQKIHQKTLEIERDLKIWREGVPQTWKYATIDAHEALSATYFNGKRHIYPNLWVAEVWNNWRTLRILVNQIIMQNELRSGVSDNAKNSLAIIHQFSAELCISTASFTDSPRILSFIRPLYVVSLEERNSRSVRSFAIEQLRRIDASMGIRQAGLLAETVSKRVNEHSGISSLHPAV